MGAQRTLSPWAPDTKRTWNGRDASRKSDINLSYILFCSVSFIRLSASVASLANPINRKKQSKPSGFTINTNCDRDLKLMGRKVRRVETPYHFVNDFGTDHEKSSFPPKTKPIQLINHLLWTILYIETKTFIWKEQQQQSKPKRTGRKTICLFVCSFVERYLEFLAVFLSLSFSCFAPSRFGGRSTCWWLAWAANHPNLCRELPF